MKIAPEFEMLSFTLGKTWCFWLDRTHPSPARDGTFRVSVVVENEPGHIPTGGNGADPFRAPWWWDDKTCEEANNENGIDVIRAFEIVASSMAQRMVR